MDMDNSYKSHSCDDPEHDHKFPTMKEMKKNLEAQLDKCSEGNMYGDQPTVEKALKASHAASLGRDARFAVHASSPAHRPIRHLGEVTPTVVHVSPVVETQSDGVIYKSCGGCGIIHKSLVECPRCAVSDSQVEATDWRTR